MRCLSLRAAADSALYRSALCPRCVLSRGTRCGTSQSGWRKPRDMRVLFLRADAGTRTPDPLLTMEVLYRLSYVGVVPPAAAMGGAGFEPA